MLKLIKQVEPTKLHQWLESAIFPFLKPDVSNYANGRMRTWFNVEPTLVKPFTPKVGTYVRHDVMERLKELVGWDFDYCLATYSGDEVPVGILPHRDAGCLSYQARSINVSGTCLFEYWNERDGLLPTSKKKKVNTDGPPTDSMVLQPGDIVEFNSKNQHAATPSIKRWSLNFWRKK